MNDQRSRSFPTSYPSAPRGFEILPPMVNLLPAGLPTLSEHQLPIAKIRLNILCATLGPYQQFGKVCSSWWRPLLFAPGKHRAFWIFKARALPELLNSQDHSLVRRWTAVGVSKETRHRPPMMMMMTASLLSDHISGVFIVALPGHRV